MSRGIHGLNQLKTLIVNVDIAESLWKLPSTFVPIVANRFFENNPR
jgi:hypothetical protein